MRHCAQCGGTLHRETLGLLGHGGSAWWECENGCSNIWGNPTTPDLPTTEGEV